MSKEECVRVMDATYIIESLEEHIVSLRKIKGSDIHIKSMENVKDAIKKVVYQADVQRDRICFVLKRG